MAARRKKTTAKKAPAKKKAPARKAPVSETQKKARPRKANKGGRPAFKPTDDQRRLVEALVGYGLTYKEIATLVINPQTGKGISSNTLERHFQDELQAGGAKVKAKVIESLVKKACSDHHPGAVTAAIWITKARFGWKGDHVTHEVEGGGVLVAPAKMTPEEWIAAAQQRNKDKKPPSDD